MRKDEAKDKWCPMYRTSEGYNRTGRCLVDGCMLWRKAHSYLECPTCRKIDTPGSNNTKCPRCATAWVPVETGYCGLAK